MCSWENLSRAGSEVEAHAELEGEVPLVGVVVVGEDVLGGEVENAGKDDGRRVGEEELEAAFGRQDEGAFVLVVDVDVLVGKAEADEGDEVGADEGGVVVGKLEVVFAHAADLDPGGRVVVGESTHAAEGDAVPEEVGVPDVEREVRADGGLEVEEAADAEFAGTLRHQAGGLRGDGGGRDGNGRDGEDANAFHEAVHGCPFLG